MRHCSRSTAAPRRSIAPSSTAKPRRASRSCATYAPRLTKEEGLIDWSQPASSIHNRVRGLHPWPHAYTFLDGARLIVLRSHPEAALTDQPPGTILRVTPEAIHVAAGNREQLAIVELQPEGRRPMKARDFLAGHPVSPGTVLSGS